MDNAGREQKFTKADLDSLDSIVKSLLEAPLVFGHPTTDASAYGWVESLKREGEKLFAYN